MRCDHDPRGRVVVSVKFDVTVVAAPNEEIARESVLHT